MSNAIKTQNMELNGNTTVNVPTDNINICFVGGVSTGKSTILNAIFCEELTQCKIKRTTMVPTIYVENEYNPFQITQPEEIFKKITDKNKELIEKTENGEKISKKEYTELMFNVGKLDINILNDAYVNVYDIPGLNDARTKDIYYEYLEEKFHKFNLLIFIVDIHSGLNTSDEIDIVNFITNNTRYQLENNNKKIYTMVIVNKADDMQLDEDSVETDKLVLTGELNEMYEQVEKTIKTEFVRKNIAEHLIGIIPLCAIDSYLYRMVKKHGKNFKLTPEQILKIGVNENGKKFSTLKPATQAKKVYEILNDNAFIETMIKLSGFSCLEKTLHKFLNENNTGKNIRINNLLFTLKKYDDIVEYLDKDKSLFPEGIENIIEKHNNIYHSIKKIDDQLYNEFITTLVGKIFIVLEKKITLYYYEDITDLIVDYQLFQNKILKVYFNDYYDTSDYPTFIKEQICCLILGYFKNNNRLSVLDLLSNISILKKINYFDGKIVISFINIFIEKNIHNDNSLFNDSQIIACLNDLSHNLNIDITKLLRFLILHRFKIILPTDEDRMFIAKMLYQTYNELPIRTWLLTIGRFRGISDKVIIDGFDEKNIINDDGFKLDLYYLNYIQNKK
jgi:GTP-binding protein EngB required for normal cell division